MTIFPHQGETPASLLATVAVKSAVAPRDPKIGREIPRHRPAALQSDGAETVGVEFL